jgi:uncharacterized protein (DUF3084 family)
MAITALEMEKFRRETEQRNLTTRLRSVTAQLRRIEAQKAVLLARLKKLPAPSPQAAVRRTSMTTAPRSHSEGGFKFQY